MMKLLDWIEPSKLDYDGLSCNSHPKAIELLENYPDKENDPAIIIYWIGLSRYYNFDPKAIELLEKLPEKIDWDHLSQNSSDRALELLEQNPDKIDWWLLSNNSHPKAIELLFKNPEKINWDLLSRNTNPKAFDLLEQNPDKISWFMLSANPSIFEYDYEAMETNCLVYKEELMKERFHPRNLFKFTSWGFNGIEEEEEEE